MLVNFFKCRGGARGAEKLIDYLYGRHRDREAATPLSGDPELSLAIAKGLDFKTKYTAGVLSFEEADIPIEQKYEIMQSFEDMLLAGIEKERYNISWVEHRDKGRLELNFFIPNVVLDTGKRLQPYYDKADRPIVDMWKQVTNARYGLTNPDDPSKKRLMGTSKRLPLIKKDVANGITHELLKLASEGLITSRSEVINLLKDSGYEVDRVSKKNISIKDPDGGRNIRLKGFIYEEQFGLTESPAEELKREIAEYEQRGQRDIGAVQERFKNALNERTERHKRLHAEVERAVTQGREGERAGDKEQQEHDYDDWRSAGGAYSVEPDINRGDNLVRQGVQNTKSADEGLRSGEAELRHDEEKLRDTENYGEHRNRLYRWEAVDNREQQDQVQENPERRKRFDIRRLMNEYLEFIKRTIERVKGTCGQIRDRLQHVEGRRTERQGFDTQASQENRGFGSRELAAEQRKQQVDGLDKRLKDAANRLRSEQLAALGALREDDELFKRYVKWERDTRIAQQKAATQTKPQPSRTTEVVKEQERENNGPSMSW